MNERYDFASIESKWQKKWAEEKTQRKIAVVLQNRHCQRVPARYTSLDALHQGLFHPPTTNWHHRDASGSSNYLSLGMTGMTPICRSRYTVVCSTVTVRLVCGIWMIAFGRRFSNIGRASNRSGHPAAKNLRLRCQIVPPHLPRSYPHPLADHMEHILSDQTFDGIKRLLKEAKEA